MQEKRRARTLDFATLLELPRTRLTLPTNGTKTLLIFTPRHSRSRFNSGGMPGTSPRHQARAAILTAARVLNLLAGLFDPLFDGLSSPAWVTSREEFDWLRERRVIASNQIDRRA